MFRHIKGTFDVLPVAQDAEGGAVPEAATWRWAEGVIRDVFARFNAREIRTPALEPTELVARGVGGSTDIVQKEMFAFERGDTHYVLRPEVTAPVMRAYLEHRLDQLGPVQKLFYLGPCFRAERPQKGRYRQFHQFGLEVIGSPDPRADAETIACMVAVYEAFGVTETRLRVNSLGTPEERARYREALRAFLLPRAEALSETSRRRLDTNPLRILDTKSPAEQALLEGAPALADVLGDASRRHYDAVLALLDAVGVAFVQDDRLVRGLDYYAHTTFELESPALGAQSALAGGGRYDGLASELGAKHPVPAVGFAAGFERLFLALDAAGVRAEAEARPDAFLVALGEEAEAWAFAEALRLRRAGLRVALDLKGRSLKAQLKEADRQGARRAVLVGADELAAGVAQLRDLARGEQTAVSLAHLPEVLAAVAGGAPA